jgi:hypothetical protein
MDFEREALGRSVTDEQLIEIALEHGFGPAMLAMGTSAVAGKPEQFLPMLRAIAEATRDEESGLIKHQTAVIDCAQKDLANARVEAYMKDRRIHELERGSACQPLTDAQIEELGLRVGLLERVGEKRHVFAAELGRFEVRKSIRELMSLRDGK